MTIATLYDLIEVKGALTDKRPWGIDVQDDLKCCVNNHTFTRLSNNFSRAVITSSNTVSSLRLACLDDRADERRQACRRSNRHKYFSRTLHLQRQKRDRKKSS